jgi:hypothetical protein
VARAANSGERAHGHGGGGSAWALLLLVRGGSGGGLSGHGLMSRGASEGERGHGGHQAPPGQRRRRVAATQRRAPERSRDAGARCAWVRALGWAGLRWWARSGAPAQ